MKIAVIPWNYYTQLDPKFTELVFFTVDENRKPVAIATWDAYTRMEHPLALSLLASLTKAQSDANAITAALHSIEEFNSARENVREMVSQG